MSSSPLNVLTGTNAAPLDAGYFSYTSPSLQLNSSSGTKLVKILTQTYFFSPQSTTTPSSGAYIQMVFSFELLAALLDSAPTNTGTKDGANIFQVAVGTKGDTTGTYVVDAQIQTKGNSAMSPTYTSITVPQSNSTTDGYVYFPVTNFFSVTSPGAPYTLTITLTKVT